MVNANYATDLLATTFEEYYKLRPSDAVFTELAVWEQMKSAGRITKQGGLKILQPVMYQKSTAVGSFSGWDTLDTTPQEGLTNAEFAWKRYFLTVAIDNETLDKNRGKMAMLNILKTRIAQAEMSLADRMNTDIFLDGTGNGGKNLTGFELAVDSAGTYGNINRTGDTWWRAKETAVAGALAIAGASGMRRMYNDCALGPTRQTPDLIVTYQAAFEAYEALMDTNTRYIIAQMDKPNAVFPKQNLVFRDARMYWDDAIQSGYMYFLNRKSLGIVELEGRGAEVMDQEEDRDAGSFRIRAFQEPLNQDAQVARAIWAGNLVCEAPYRNGKLTGLTN